MASGISRQSYLKTEEEGRINVALIDCPECGGKVSENAFACPQCGFSFGYDTSIGSGLRKRVWSEEERKRARKKEAEAKRAAAEAERLAKKKAEKTRRSQENLIGCLVFLLVFGGIIGLIVYVLSR